MKKNGFTLVELLAVILILGMIAIIAVPSYLSVTKSINKGLYETKIKEVKDKAIVYAESASASVFNVGDLIKEGLLSADNETGEYYDNYNNRSMLCDVLRVSYDKSKEDSISIINSDVCYSREELESMYGLVHIDAKFYEDSEATKETDIGGNGWSKAKLARLSIAFNDSSKESEYRNKITSITWYGNNEKTCVKGSSIPLSECEYYDVTNNDVTTAQIGLMVDFDLGSTVSGEYGQITNDVFTVSSQRQINLDVESPKIDENGIYVSEGFSSSSKIINVNMSDGIGSGLASYKVYKDSSVVYENNDVLEGINQINLDKNGDFTIEVTDKIGNVSSKAKFSVDNIDKSAPVVSKINATVKGLDGWTNTDLKLSIASPSNDISSYYYYIDNNVEGSSSTAKAWARFTYPTDNNLYITNNKNNYSNKNVYETNDIQKYVHVMAIDKAGNQSNVFSNKVWIDRTMPTITYKQVANETELGTNGWYKNLKLIATYADPKSNGVASGLQQDKNNLCDSNGKNCKQIANYVSNTYTKKFGTSSSEQRICLEATDKASNSKVYCSDYYKVDYVSPKVDKLTVTQNATTVSAVINASDTGSGVYRYYCKINNGTYKESKTNTCNFTNQSETAKNTVTVKVVDTAGNESVEKSFTIPQITIKYTKFNGSVEQRVINKGARVRNAPIDSRTGYTFLGWYDKTYTYTNDNNNYTRPSFSIDTCYQKDTTFYYGFKLNYYDLVLREYIDGGRSDNNSIFGRKLYKINSNGGQSVTTANRFGYGEKLKLVFSVNANYLVTDSRYSSANNTYVYQFTITGKTTIDTHGVSNFYFDLNGSSGGNLGGMGTADIYLDGRLVANDVDDFYQRVKKGTKVKVTDVKAKGGYDYNGVTAGEVDKDISMPASNYEVKLSFSVHYEPSYDSDSDDSLYWETSDYSGRFYDSQEDYDAHNDNYSCYGPHC